MAPKTNLKSHTSTKTSKHTKASENQDTLGNQEQSDDSEYIKFDPSNRRHVDLLWEDLYQHYLLDLLKKDEKFYNETKKLENILKSNPGLAGILVLFKKIVPTIQLNDYEPYRLLYDALVEAEYNHNYNNLCIFVRIATTRLNELRALVKTKYDESNKGLGGNVFSIESTNKEKREGAELLIPLFEEIIRNKQDFYTEYKKTIVPKLIENRKVFLKILCTIIDAKKTIRKSTKSKKRLS